MNFPSGGSRFLKPADTPIYQPISTEQAPKTVLPTTEKNINADVDAHTSFVYNRHHHLSLETQRQKLPIFQYKNHILYLLEKYQTLVLVGETGSGKSTQIPQYLVEGGYCSNNGSIVVTGPRVVAAVSLAKRVAVERGTICGTTGTVGYAVSFDNQYGPQNQIKYVTEGILLREMFSDPLLTQYSCIVLDEVHERSLLTDVIMGLVKKIMKKRKTLRVIVSSATMDAEFLCRFFNLNKKSNKTGKDQGESTSTIISVQGRAHFKYITHPVEVYYSKEPVPDYLKATVDTVMKIHETEPFGDILAFLTAQDEIMSVVRTLKEYAENAEKNPSLFKGRRRIEMNVVPLYGSLPNRDQLKAFEVGKENVRKVVISTNIAETSVTIPGVVYVIDCGFHKVRYFDCNAFLDNLIICPISKANAIQRSGRAGRTAKGKCYRLYSEKEYDKLSDNVSPEMQRSDLSAIVLQLKALGIDNILRFTFPSPPPSKILLSSIEVLYALGAIDEKGQLTHPLGVNMAEIPLKPAYAKILCISGEFGCLNEILTIISMLQVENVFIRPEGGRLSIKAKVMKRNTFEVAEGDLITMLNVYDAYKKHLNYSEKKGRKKYLKDWCHRLFLDEKSLNKVHDIRTSLEKLATKKLGIKNNEKQLLGGAKMEIVLRCLCAGLFMNACFLHHSGCYKTLRSDHTNLYISPNSCLYNAQQPQWLIYSDIQSSSDKMYIKDLIVIQKEWLTELAPHYYKES